MIGLLEQNSIKKDSTNSAKESDDRYLTALDSYNAKANGYQRGVGNPVYDIINEQSNETVDKNMQRKYERAAAFTGLNKVFHGLSSMVSAANGIKPQSATGSKFESYLGKLDSAKNKAEDSYNDLYKDKLNASIDMQGRINVMNDKHLDGLNDLRKTANDNEQSMLKLSDKKADRAEKHFSAMLKNTKPSRAASSGVKSAKITERTPDMYIYNGKGKRVPLYQEDMTKLHQIGKLNNLDGDYKRANNNQERSSEYNIMMQRSYLLYERNKDNLLKQK